MDVVAATRFGVFLVCFDPTIGSEIQKTRPCVVISPDELNEHLRTVIIAPMTTRSRSYPSRVAISFQNKEGEIVLDQIRTIDKLRLVKYLGKIDTVAAKEVLLILSKMFAE